MMLQLHRVLRRVFRSKKDFCDNCREFKRFATSTYGQPTHESHPHLISDGEVTPLVRVQEFQDRRKRLLETVLEYNPEQKRARIKSHLIVVPAASKRYMSDKIPYTFRQNSDFLYFTGCLEPDSCLILRTEPGLRNAQSVLFVRSKDEHSELWDGPRTGPSQAVSLFGVDESLPIEDLRQFVQTHAEKSDCLVWYDPSNAVQRSVHEILDGRCDNPVPYFHKLRLNKSQAEIDLMQKSCDIASEAIAETIKKSRPPIDEHEIYATIDYECRIRGANYLAYPPVIAGGSRANIIHYINNNQIVRENETVLMDAGCEYYGYSSDITRTWPISGRFSPRQREIYELVLSVQKELIELCSNYPSLDTLFHVMTERLGKGLQEVGVVSKSLSGNALAKKTYEFCPHHVSHYLGMDVHDTSTVPRNIMIKPGMIITVEPGIYINDRMADVPADFYGIGIRIEDDVLITENGPVILTKNCPKEVDDVEKIAGAS